MKRKQIMIMAILAMVIAYMEISGMPSVLWIHIQVADVTPIIFSLIVNFLLIGIVACVILKLFGKDWPLGIHRSGFCCGVKKYGVAGMLAGILSCIVFCIGLAPFDYTPTVWKILWEGIVYYIGVAIVEEFYVRGIFLNIVDKLACKNVHHNEIAILVSSIAFGLGHIPGMLGMGVMVILPKTISTIGMGLYFGTVYKKTGNLWIPILLHAFIDICALPYCFTTFTGYKPISLIGLLIIYTVLGIYSILLMKNRIYTEIK